MTTSSYPSPATDGDRFTHNGVRADAQSAARIRDDFAAWLRSAVGLDEVRFSDVVLAVNEALANAAEFAYLKHDAVGTVDVEAIRDGDGATLTVTIADQGCWREPDPAGNSRVRGRGIPLMRALADDVTIDTSALGTTVCLRFEKVHAGEGAKVG